MGEQLRKSLPWVLVGLLAGLLVYTTIRDFDWPKIIEDWRPNVIFVSAGVGAASLAFAAVSFAHTKRVERKAAALEAWASWSTSLRRERTLISKHIAYDKISDEQARALATASQTVVNRHGVELSYEEKSELLDAVLAVLNGLEHIALGVRCRLYNRRVLTMIGGTVMITTWKRYAPYIEITRGTRVNKTDQRRAWLQYERLVQQVVKQRRLEDERAKSQGD